VAAARLKAAVVSKRMSEGSPWWNFGGDIDQLIVAESSAHCGRSVTVGDFVHCPLNW
jgi:hypothetical protein